MTGRDDTALDEIEQALAERNGEYDLPDDLLSSSDHEPSPATGHRVPSEANEDARFPYVRKNTFTGTIRAHTQIYVVNEQIIHGKSTWSSSLCAFDNLHSANTEARTHAMLRHAKGDTSMVQVSFRDGYGTWTTNLDTERGRITKSVFVSATVLQHLVTPQISEYEEQAASGDRIIPSRVPGSQRVRRIQAFRSTDSIRMESEQSNRARHDAKARPARPPKPAMRENLARRNQTVADLRVSRNDYKGQDQEVTVRPGKENTVGNKSSIDDLRNFASLHTLF